jgi:hypothetical protein
VAEITCLFASDPANSGEDRTVDLARLFGQAEPAGPGFILLVAVTKDPGTSVSSPKSFLNVNSFRASRDTRYTLRFKGLPASGALH